MSLSKSSESDVWARVFTFLEAAASPHMFHVAILSAPSCFGANEILTGSTLFVGCPLAPRPLSVASCGVVLAFFDVDGCTSDSLSSVEAAFRFPDELARLAGGLSGFSVFAAAARLAGMVTM